MTRDKILLYKKADAELYEIIQNLAIEERNKIPDEFIENIKKNMDKDHNFKLDISKPIFEQNLMLETKALIIQVYKNYLAPVNEKEFWEKYDKICNRRIEREKLEKYDSNIIFKNSNKNADYDDINKYTDENEQTSLIIYKENIFKKIWNWFKNEVYKWK